MSTHRIDRRTAGIAMILGLLLTGTIAAQELERGMVASGGETSSGGRFEVVALTGQPVVGRAEGDDYVLRVGALVPRPGAAGSLVFTDSFENLPASRSEATNEESLP